MKPVFIVVDLQEDFFAAPLLAERRPGLCDAVNDLTAFARGRAYPVVWVRQEFAPDRTHAFVSLRATKTRITIAGTDGCALLKELVRAPRDHEIVKKRYSAFFGTRLASLLTDLACDRIVFAGVNSHACVRASAIDAFQLDDDVVLAADAIASYDEQYHRESMRYLAQSIGDVLDNVSLKRRLAAPASPARDTAARP